MLRGGLVNLAEWLGIVALIASAIAIGIAIKSDRVVKAISNLSFDEKLAMMAIYLINTKTDKSRGIIERIRNDFSAVSNLKDYTKSDRKEKLIVFYIIPILDNLLDGGNIHGESAVLIKEIIDVAQSYNIQSDKISNIRLKLRDK